MEKILHQKDQLTYDEDSTQVLSFGSISLPQTGVRDQPTMTSSSCSSSESSTARHSQSSWSVSSSATSSSSSTTSSMLFSDSQERTASLISMESSSTLFSATQSYDDDSDEYAEMHSNVSSILEELDFEPQQGNVTDSIVAKNSTDSEKSSSTTKLSLELDDVLRLVKLGRSAGIRNRYQLPPNTVHADIHVRVDIDQKLDCGKFGEIILSAIQQELSAVYSADLQSAKFVLCAVIVAMTDGSLFRSLSARHGVMGLTELGLVWRLFEADNLTVYDGGVVVKSHDMAGSSTKIMQFFDPLGIRGRRLLLNKMAPAVANDIMSRIADADDSLLCEI